MIRHAGLAALSAVPLIAAALATPAVGHAAECGPGTVFDPASNLCLVAPGGAPAAWNAPLPPLPPISICPPIPFVAVCFPVN